MTARDALVAEAPGCLAAIEGALAGMAERVRASASWRSLDEADVLELATLSANVAHVVTYVEGNQRHLDLGSVRALRDELLDDPAVDEALLALLAEARCHSPEARRARQDLVGWLEERARSRALPSSAVVAARYDEARDLLAAIEGDQGELLERLGVRAQGAPPSLAFYRVVSTTANAATRTKLVRAWDVQRSRRVGPLVRLLDGIVEARREAATADGAATVLERTLRRSQLDEARAEAFVDAYLGRAVEASSRLAARISAATGATDHPLDHFGAYVRTLVDGADIPSFPLDGCLDLLVSVTSEVFGVSLTTVPAGGPHELVVAGHVDGRQVGVASFDLLGGGTGRPCPAPVAPGGDGTEGAVPAARVLCRYQLGPGGERVVSFDSVHSMFHEFGHVVNHWLLRRRTPSDSGLDYLPLERVEDLSTWFEKWVYHPAFADRLSLSQEQAAGLAVCARVKRLEFLSANLDRAVVAAVDLDVHRRSSGGLEDSFRRLDERFGVAGLCRFGAIAGYFTWPMCRAHPGANLAYLWGAAFGAQAILPWLGPDGTAGTPSPAEAAAILAPCFDPDAPSEEPDLDALFRFYDADG